MSGFTDDAVREVHGVKCHDGSGKHATVVIREGDRSVVFDQTLFSGAALTPWQARYLASKLYRISRRIRNRQADQPVRESEAVMLKGAGE